MTNSSLSQLGAADPHRHLVLRNAEIVSMDPAVGDIHGDIHLMGNRIVDLGAGLDVPAGSVELDLGGKVVLPGFVDSHVHAWEGQLRGFAPEADFGEYSRIVHHEFAPRMRPKDVAVGQAVTIAQAINGGITTIVDNSHNARTPEHSDAALSAVVAAGIRCVHAVGAPQNGEQGQQLPSDALRLREQYGREADGLITLRLFEAMPSLQTWRFARENQLGVVVEMGPWIPELEALLASDLVDSDHTYNHCVGLSAAQWARIGDSGAAVNMAPRSDPQFGLAEQCPILSAERAGVQVGISGDNELCYGLDMFAEMRMLLAVQRGLALQARNRGESGAPEPYRPVDVLRAATLGGALNAGLPDSIGTLSIGKRADLVVLDLDTVRSTPRGSTSGAVVSFAGIENVYGVFIDGVIRKWDGRLVYTDYASVCADAEESLAYLSAGAH